MKRLFITNIVPNGIGIIGAHGFYQNGSVYSLVCVDGIQYDPTLTDTVRQQLIDGIVSKFNSSKQFSTVASEADIVFSEIEILC